MNMFPQPVKKILLILMMLGLQGCNDKQAAQNNHQDATATDQKAYVKPQAAIYLNYNAPAMEVGVEAVIPVTITSGKKVDDLTIRYFVKDEAINLYNANTPVSFGPQDKDQLNQHELTLIPAAEGEYRIYLSATATKNAKSQSRSFVIPVRVGDLRHKTPAKPIGVIMQDETGSPIISMPAVETTD